MAGKITDARPRVLKPADAVQKVSDGGGCIFISLLPGEIMAHGIPL